MFGDGTGVFGDSYCYSLATMLAARLAVVEGASILEWVLRE